MARHGIRTRAIWPIRPFLYQLKKKTKNLEIIQATSAQTSTEETRQTKEPKQYDSHSTPGEDRKIRRFFLPLHVVLVRH